jgi:DegV family protein with EDD domain
MSKETVAVITDSGSSIRPESSLAKELDVISVPLNVKFLEINAQGKLDWVSYEDSDTELPSDTFYQKMAQSSKLPQTSGAIPGKLFKHYEELVAQDRPIISIHITARHSEAYGSAALASKMTKEKYPHALIEVVDGKNVSIGTWFLVELAAKLANEGYPLKDINKIVLEAIPNIHLTASLSTFKNAVAGGRLNPAAGFVGSSLHLRPTVALVSGKIEFQGVTRTAGGAQKELISRVENTKEDITKLAVVHTNFLEGAIAFRKGLAKIYSGNIGIHEAGPLLGVHTGEKCLAVVIMED